MISGVAAACEGPQLSPEGRDRALAFLRLHRRAARAFESMQPDAFVHRLIERIGIRRQQLFASQADTAERLANISKLVDLASAYVRRYPQGSPRDFARYLTAVAEAGLPEDEVVPAGLPKTVAIVSMHAAREMEVDHAFVAGLDAAALPGSARRRGDGVPDPLLRETLPEDGHRRTRGADAAAAPRGDHARAQDGRPVVGRGRRRVRARLPSTRRRARPPAQQEEFHEEQLFGPAEGLHATFRMMRDEVLDSVSRVAGRLGEMRLDTYMDVGVGDDALPRAAEGGGPRRAHEGGADGRGGAARDQRTAPPGGHARGARAVPDLGARRVPARRGDRRAAARARDRRATTSSRSRRSSRAAATA